MKNEILCGAEGPEPSRGAQDDILEDVILTASKREKSL